MDLKDFFKIQSKASAAKWNVGAPSIEVLSSPRRKLSTGVRSTFDFDDFKFTVTYLESGRAAYAQQTIWLSVSLDESLVLPYSIYDVLAFCEPENFNCYTYTYVDSKELMIKCFEEIGELIERLAPEFKEVLSNGIDKNRFITNQRKAVNDYFGDNVIENSEMVGGAADKLVAFMLENFYEAQIEAAVVGSQSFFYNSDSKKALKKLQKSKSRTLYQENLMKYLENGGESFKASQTVREASQAKGAARHSGDDAKILLYLLLFTVAVSTVLCVVYLGIIHVMFRESHMLLGVKENLFVFPFSAIVLAIPFALSYSAKKRETTKKGNITSVYRLSVSPGAKTALKYFTVLSEALMVLVMFFAVFSTVSFEETGVRFSESDYPVSNQECRYESIEEVAVVRGFYEDGEYIQKDHIIIKTVSGQFIDLYNSSFMSIEEFYENAAFLKDKNVTLSEYKSVEEMRERLTGEN